MSPFQERKKIVLCSLALAAALVIFSLLHGRADWILGIGAGTATGLINFYLLARDITTIEQSGTKRQAKPQQFTGRFFVRYLLLGGAFLLAYKVAAIHFLAFVAGFALVYLALGAAYLARLVRVRKD